MPERSFSITVALIALLAVGATAAADEYDHDAVRRLREQGRIVPLQTLIEDAGRRYEGGRILEAELEQHDGYGLVYEIEFLAADGQKRKLYYDAASGQLLIYEVYETDARGRLRNVEYDARTGRRLDDDDEDDD